MKIFIFFLLDLHKFLIILDSLILSLLSLNIIVSIIVLSIFLIWYIHQRVYCESTSNCERDWTYDPLFSRTPK